MPDLTIRDLVVEYKSGDYAVRPIDGLNLDLPAGSLNLLLGPSGCGKTTLLSCMGAILTPTSGSIRLGDTDVTGLSGSALTQYRRRSVGIVFQAFNLVPSMSALENVATPLWAVGTKGKAARDRAAELLEQVGLGERMHHKPSDLSGGQQQRVAVARALALDPPLILADEPTAHLDYIQVEEMLKLIRTLASGERIVVVSTHDNRMIPLADEVVEMVPDFINATVPPHRVELTAGQVLFEQGSMGERIYVIESGEIEIVRVHADGTEERKTTLGSGDYFGEMGPLFGLPRSAMARAVSAGVVTGYTVRDFRSRVGDQGLSAVLDHASSVRDELR